NGVVVNELVHQDYLAEIERFALKNSDDLAVIIRQIVKSQKLVDEKLNVKMSLSLLREYIWGN
ncbi:MAG: hypothetical protein HQL13_06375, partial [Candidatus Omnitrophica bacterium]|nr:hypothetical protein [Candidatus Omnitrophota bacterium]